ncbi:hypothetical protein NE237_022375 [Protea cynaroides]|uniref:Uncharacterized protein n=1 Tax=Protea cynaroides TaxID=273540 RepID=A0A9Q0H9H6_9MAGN|nr:hypothetical protein NE237_022375 [Protea cynaroides]
MAAVEYSLPFHEKRKREGCLTLGSVLQLWAERVQGQSVCSVDVFIFCICITKFASEARDVVMTYNLLQKDILLMQFSFYTGKWEVHGVFCLLSNWENPSAIQRNVLELSEMALFLFQLVLRFRRLHDHDDLLLIFFVQKELFCVVVQDKLGWFNCVTAHNGLIKRHWCFM